MRRMESRWPSQKKKGIKFILFLMLLGSIGVGGANAAVIFDTGTPPAGSAYPVRWNSYLAAQFTLTQSYFLTTAEGYFSGGYGEGSMNIVIHNSLSGNIPGAAVYSQNFVIDANTVSFWKEFTLTGMSLTPGTYWLAFEPAAVGSYSAYSGWMPTRGSGDTRVTNYAFTEGDWYEWSNLNIGVRLSGTPNSVPEPSTLLLLGGGLMGLVGYGRRRVKK